MYKNILVPIAFDEARDSKTALEIAHAISEEGAKITALHVVEEIPSYVAQYLPEGQMAKNLHEIEASLTDKIKDEIFGIYRTKKYLVTGPAPMDVGAVEPRRCDICGKLGHT